MARLFFRRYAIFYNVSHLCLSDLSSLAKLVQCNLYILIVFVQSMFNESILNIKNRPRKKAK